jgi:EmrB/QacA subfamily drug resistance transporter
MLSANSPAILTKSFPPHKRGQALGLQATMTYLGLTVGPSLGGWLTEAWSWRAVFYINVPVGLIAFLLSLRFIASDEPHGQTERFDWQGAGAFMAGLTLLLFGLNQGHALGWTSPVIAGSLALAVAVLGFFVYLQAHVRAPMLDLSLFASRVFSGSTLSAVLNYICVNTITFLTPFYLLQGRGLRPSEAGLLLTAMPVIMAIVAPISGTLSDRIGARLPAVLGMLLLAAGLWSLSSLGPDTSWVGIAWRLALAGLGTGIFISPNTSALMGAAPRERQGIASGILATSRNFGMVLGVGLAGAIFTSLAGSSETPDPNGVIMAIRTAYQVAAGVALAGLVLAALKPRHVPTQK